MKTLRVIVTTKNGTILDADQIEVPDDTVAIEYRAINTSISKSGLMETLNLGKNWKDDN